MPYPTLKHDIVRPFQVCGMKYEVALRAGMRCRRITEGGTYGMYWIDEFPVDLFPVNSMLRHDATHYGILIDPSDVEDANA